MEEIVGGMAYNQYSNYGGNPYGGEQQQAGGYGSSNPYASEAGGNPYGGGYGQSVSGHSFVDSHRAGRSRTDDALQGTSLKQKG